MLIKELHIQNFRRFEDLKVSFEKDLTVLVARNGPEPIRKVVRSGCLN
jgi:predicted ATP-dependent endonuclease of OLD family